MVSHPRTSHHHTSRQSSRTLSSHTQKQLTTSRLVLHYQKQHSQSASHSTFLLHAQSNASSGALAPMVQSAQTSRQSSLLFLAQSFIAKHTLITQHTSLKVSQHPTFVSALNQSMHHTSSNLQIRYAQATQEGRYPRPQHFRQA